MPAGIPRDASLNGHLVDGILAYLTVATSICFLIMVGVLLAAVLFHRGARGPARYGRGDTRGARILTALVGATIFLGIDAVALRRATTDLRHRFWSYPDGDPGALRVEVTAQQWAWTFRYPGADGRFDTADDIVTLNELHVPLGTPVYLKLRSKDVVHSFYLPNFRTKIDAIPGSTTRLWFQAEQAGRFEIGCAQHCGVNHYKMRGELIASRPDDFRRWAARAAEDAARRRDTGVRPAPEGRLGDGNVADERGADGWDWES
jgi:cytochrome c oxidase subunit 2